MDASELLTVAMDAMPLMVLESADQGQVYGVLSMALRTLEAQHATLLAEADEENRNAMTVIADMTQQEAKLQAELLRLHKEVKTVTAERDARSDELRNRDANLQAMEKERDAANARYIELADSSKQDYHDLLNLAAEASKRTDETVSTRNAVEVALRIFAMYEAEAGELQHRIDNLNAENARLHRSMEEWMSAAQHAQALPPGGVKVK